MSDKPPIVVKPKETKMADEPKGVMFTPEMLQALIDGLGQKQIEAIKELKKLDPYEQEKLDTQRQREKEHRISRVREAVQDEHLRRQVQFACSHIKQAEGVYQQSHAFRGQVNNDNTCRPLCIRCTKLFPPFKVTEENLKSGMHLENIKNLTAEALWHAHMRSFPECPECKKGNCAVRDLREKKQGHLDAMPEVLPDGKVRAATLTA